MKRSVLAGAGLILMLVFAAPASAQSGCTQADPCPWIVDVDEGGFLDGQAASWNWTAGDWVRLSLFNFDFEDHFVTFQGHEWRVPGIDGVDPAPFRIEGPGVYRMADTPSGDEVNVIVDGLAAPTARTPGPSMGAALVAMAAALVVRRRQG